MPLYEYQCEACNCRFEVIRKFSDPPVETCRTCGGSPVRRLVSSPAIQFKGTGWYITDYSQKGKPPSEAAGGEKGDKGDKGEKGDKSAPGEKKEGASGSDKETKSTSSSDSSSGGGDSASKPSTPTTT
jgi:putative FmdB family regulatory protein